MRLRPPEGLTLRIALLAGFGLTFGLWLVTGYLVTQRMSAAQAEAAAVNARYVAAQDMLSQVRAQVLLASVVLRDALLEPSPKSAGEYRGEVQRIYRSVNAGLDSYLPAFDTPEERQSLDRLRQEIRSLEAESTSALDAAGDTWPTDPRALLKRIMPKREAAIEVSEEVQGVNRVLYVSQREEAAAAQAGLQEQAWTAIGIALVISAAIAWLAFRYGVSLEAKLVDQRRREQQIGADLQRLSARLVHVQEDERRRIARELHDEVGQALTAVQVELALVRQRLPTVPDARSLVADAEAMTSGALRAVRDLSQLLHPSALDDLGLSAALGSYVHGFGRRQGLHAELVEDGLDGRLSPDAERAAYRIVQEALTNVARHARATSCRVRLSSDDHALHVVVEDDGVGFDAAGVESPGRRHGLGLLGMRERVAQLRGVIAVHSRPGAGTRIEIALPDAVMPADLHSNTESTRELSPIGAEASRG
jgi:signal transduction histidine kinase